MTVTGSILTQPTTTVCRSTRTAHLMHMLAKTCNTFMCIFSPPLAEIVLLPGHSDQRVNIMTRRATQGAHATMDFVIKNGRRTRRWRNNWGNHPCIVCHRYVSLDSFSRSRGIFHCNHTVVCNVCMAAVCRGCNKCCCLQVPCSLLFCERPAHSYNEMNANNTIHACRV